MRRILSIADIIIQAIFLVLIIATGYPLLSDASANRDIPDGLIMMALGYVSLSSAVHTMRSWRNRSVAAGLHKFFLFGLLFFAGIVLGDDFNSARLNYVLIPLVLFLMLCIYSKSKHTGKQ